MNKNVIGTPPKKNKKSLLDDPRYRMLLAVVLAVACWMAVTMVVRPGTTGHIYNVPVDFNYNSSQYTSMGLSIVNSPSYTVTLALSGDGSVIGGLDRDDFVVYPKYSSVKGPGAATLQLEVRCTADNANNVKVTIEPEDTAVDLVFDTVEEKVVPVRIVTQGITVAEDYTLFKTTAAPGEITISGPSGELEKVTQAIAVVSAGGELDQTTTVQTQLIFADAEGSPVTFTYAKPEATTADVTLTIYRHAELPITFTIINAPDGFDVSCLNYSLSQQTLEVAGPAEVIDSMTEVNVGVIDLSTFQMDKVYDLPITLPGNLVSQENVTSIRVSFDTSELATKTLNLPASSVRVVNLPASYKLTVRSDRIMNVTLCGPADVLDGLTADAVVAEIDANDFPIVTGQQNIAVRIYVPSSNQVFATGSYTVQCQIVSD